MTFILLSSRGRKSERSLTSEGRQDAGGDRRCGNGRLDDGIGAATVRRLRIDRYLRANQGAQHRRRRVEHPAQRGADMSLAGRRPRWRGSPGPRRVGRWWPGGHSGVDTAVQHGRERNKEAVRSCHRRGRRRRVSSYAQAGPVDVPVQAGVRVRSRQRRAVPDHRAHGLQADTVAPDRRRGDGDLFEWPNRHRRGSRRCRRDQLRHVAVGVAESAAQALDRGDLFSWTHPAGNGCLAPQGRRQPAGPQSHLFLQHGPPSERQERGDDILGARRRVVERVDRPL